MGIEKLVLYGGGYWFLYVLFIILMLYPLIDSYSLVRKACLAVTCMLVWGIFNLPKIFKLDAVIQYLPYFIIGDLFAKRFKGVLNNRSSKQNTMLLLFGLLICTLLDVLDIKGCMDPILIYPRALAIIIVLYVMIGIHQKKPTKVKFFSVIDRIIVDCSRYSLQLYLFNGYLLTVIRTILCKTLHITTPVLLVISIWFSNIIITLIMCKKILPHIPVLRELCGLHSKKLRKRVVV